MDLICSSSETFSAYMCGWFAARRAEAMTAARAYREQGCTATVCECVKQARRHTHERIRWQRSLRAATQP